MSGAAGGASAAAGATGAGPGAATPGRPLVPTVPLLGYDVSLLDTAATVAFLAGAAAGDLGRARPLLATYLNPHVVDRALRDAELAAALRAFDVRYPDGVGLLWAARLAGRRLPERVTASDFLPDFARAAAARGVRVFLLGGREGVAARAAERLVAAAPGLAIAGVHHGHYAEADEAAVVAAVRAARPDAVVVALGTPRQERWIAAHAGELGARLVWAVGGALDFHSGLRPRAPRWLQAAGLEWTYRWAQEPRRLTSRYVAGNARFVLAALREALPRRRSP